MPSSVCSRLQFCSPHSTRQNQEKNLPPTGRLRLAVFDARVPDLNVLLSGLQKGVRPFVMASDKDGVMQISEILKLIPVHEIEIVAPGFRGGLRLGTTTLTLDNLTHYEHQLRSWFTDVDSPEMSLLASNVAGGTIGSEFIAQLKTITGARVRASTQRIGQGHWLTSTAKTFKPLVLNTYSATI